MQPIGPRPPLSPVPTTSDTPAPGSGKSGGVLDSAPHVVTAQSTAELNRQLLQIAANASGEQDLPMGPGDLIEVSVFEVEELSKLKVRLPLRGVITLPLLGSLQASGRTAVELEDDIRTRLRERYLHDPQVAVFVVEHRSQRISVLGAVRKGGVITPTERLRLSDALALAEGLTDEADHVVYLIRRVPAGTAERLHPSTPGTSAAPATAPTVATSAAAPGATEEVTVPIDLQAIAAGNQDINAELRTGDVVHVPRVGSYYVGGSVERPGSFLLRGQTTVDQAIVAAGGPRDVADEEDVRVYRTRPDGTREVVTLSLKDAERGAPMPIVGKNDVVMVGKSSSKVFFYGAARFLSGMLSVSKGF